MYLVDFETTIPRPKSKLKVQQHTALLQGPLLKLRVYSGQVLVHVKVHGRAKRCVYKRR